MQNSSHTLLIVDDEPFNLDILQEHLEDEGYNIVRADNGMMALEIIKSKEYEFSAILLDRMMPKMDGIEVLMELNSLKDFQRIPVIIQTAAASDSDIQEGIEAGAFYYLTKPFEPGLMLSVVKSAVLDRENMKVTEKNAKLLNDLRDHIKDVVLEFRSIKEAQTIAGVIASLYPNPDKVAIGLAELAVNAVEHGNLGISYDEKSRLLNENCWHEEIENRLLRPEHRSKVATIHFQKLPDEIHVTVRDQGEGFDWSKFKEMDTERIYSTHGRGIALASMISFDNLEYKGIGNEVVCVSKISNNE